MEEYGFIYLWRDRKHNRYYLGAHWGNINDGYDCSSRWMRAAMKRRPADFKRRILEYVYDKCKLYDIEYKWLSMIKVTEIKIKYYNLRVNKFNNWSAYPEKVKTIKEKISYKTKEAMSRPDVRANYEEGLKTRDNHSSDPHAIEKRRQSMIKTMAEKFPEENRRKALTEEERTQYYSDKAKTMHANRSEQQRGEVGKKISEANTGKKMRLGQTNSDDHRKKISEALKGKIHPRHKIIISDVVYESTVLASKELGISVATICRRLQSNKYPEYLRIGE